MNKRIFTGNYFECKAGNLISISHDKGKSAGFEENNISVEDGKIKASHSSVDGAFLYFQDYRIEGKYDEMLYNALVLEPKDEYVQAKAVEVLERLEFELRDDSIVYRDTISEDFENEKSEIKVVESNFKEAFKNDLKEFLKSKGYKIKNEYIKVINGDNGYQIRFCVEEVVEGIREIKEYHIYFGLYGELEKVAEALINGTEIELPEYEYQITHYNYIEITTDY